VDGVHRKQSAALRLTLFPSQLVDTRMARIGMDGRGDAAGIAGELWVTRSLWDTTIKVMWWFSPFNWKGWLLMLGLFAPGAVCLWSSQWVFSAYLSEVLAPRPMTATSLGAPQ